ncbi:hypothetical protein FGO68_gene8911 [Halteria grandinella]|uniref:TLDc domain-containing protein n=1 Tax=Halteria grandinella TaxID=5974 RepID=A0A8J8NR33_HALGN|nr:hypothetical protein FGO68_gene8911 [Halteria grandinella]
MRQDMRYSNTQAKHFAKITIKQNFKYLQMVEKTVHEQHVSQMQNLPFCTEHPTEKVVYQCIKESCPNFTKLKLYCFKCNEGDSHDHKSTLIVFQVSSSEERWKDIRQRLSQIKGNTDSIIDQFNDVITVLDQILTNAAISLPKLANEIKSFVTLHGDVNKFYEDYINQYIIVSNIIKLNEYNGQLSEFEQTFQSFEYLKQSAPLIMWRYYSEIIDDVQIFNILDVLSEHSLILILMLKLQKIELSIKVVNHVQQIPLNLRILEEAENFNPKNETSKLLAQVNATKCVDVEILSKIDKIRSQLDTLGVTTTLISQKTYNQSLSAIIGQHLIEFKTMKAQIEEMKKDITKQQKTQEFQEVSLTRLDKKTAYKFQNSKIIKNQFQNSMMGAYFTQAGIPEFETFLLYQGSRDGFGAKDFHKNCDNKGFTITIVETDQGEVLGGFTVQLWESESNFKHDDRLWVFNMNNPKIERRRGHSIHTRGDIGPYFLGAFEIKDKSNTHNNSYYEIKDSKVVEIKQIFILQQKVEQTSETKSFKVKEIEVYRVAIN